MSQIKKLIVVAAVSMASLTSAQADVNGDSTLVSNTQHTVAALTQTSLDHFQAEINENTDTLSWEIAGVDNNEEVEISLINLEGKTVYQINAGGYSSTVNLDSNIAPGIYMVQMRAGSVQKPND
ncbi:T9SS type A sorting domain-containing protein [Fulvivirga sp. M361]|uniref:T9SS type A sorting domain-containing protein n=1 Tax=Fulvivirga sp. M361 TaxID=2594266 RepID=UPI00117BB57F|nr:T9SS type A sorting domain-containing protein [Fulvivirga sp. M361]TRX60747.1 T9SS type A sorting domain-containing protein [Fulvivirga sp. M361]